MQNNVEELKEKLENISKSNMEKTIIKKLGENENLRFQKEKVRKDIFEEDELLQDELCDILTENVLENKKFLGYLKRYVLIGIVTGVPGIAMAYLVDKWQENKMIKELYKKTLESIANPENKSLYKEYEIMQKNFYKVYKIDKIEDFIKSSSEIEKLRKNNKAIKKLSDEIVNYREEYEKSLKYYIENQIKMEMKNNIECAEQDEENVEEMEMYKK